MKRIFQRKVSLKLCQSTEKGVAGFGERMTSGDLHGGSIKSATAVSLALSVAATGLLLHQEARRVVAAESQGVQHNLFDAQASSGTSYSFQASSESWNIYRPITVAQVSGVNRSSGSSVDEGKSHVVREGDTLWSIAQLYRLSDEALIQFNDLPTDHVLQIGQVLRIPLSNEDLEAHSNSRRGESVSSRANLAPQNLAQRQVRDVSLNPLKVSGSESSSISTLQMSNSSDDLAETGALQDEAIARLRQRREQLRASLAGVRSEDLTSPPSAAETESSRSSAEIVRALSSDAQSFRNWQEPREFVSPLSSRSSHIAYEIRQGDTLAAVARAHGVSLSAIVEMNSISNPNRIFVGQSIRIPVQVEGQSQPADIMSKASEGSSVSGSSSELLVSVLPSARFTTTSTLPAFRSAPVVPLPASPSHDSRESTEIEAAPFSSDRLSDGPAAANNLEAAEIEQSVAALETESAATPSVSETYVENLIQDFEAISRPEQSIARQTLLDQLGQISQRDGVSSYRLDGDYIEEQGAVNPEFRAEVTQEGSLEHNELADDSSTGSRSEEALVAVAPLGARNYSPISQPATGRIVSPDLPPLPGAENYIPSSEATFNGYLWPARGVLTSGYGWRWGRMHQGIDIAAPIGTPIYAAAPGVVEFSGWNSGGYGNMVDIRHPDGSKTRYAHNSRNLVRVGQRVAQGHQIAEMGSTGYSTGPHVHFEIHHAERGVINPIALLPSR